jgi:hypothetical protein
MAFEKTQSSSHPIVFNVESSVEEALFEGREFFFFNVRVPAALGEKDQHSGHSTKE